MLRPITIKSAAAVAAAAATGVFTAPAQAVPPAPLAPAGCQQFALPAVVSISISDDTNLTFNSSGATIDAPTTIGAPGADGTPGALQGTFDPATGGMDFHFIHGANDDRHFKGNAFDDLTVSGDVQPGGQNWHTVAPLICTKEAQKADPTITSDVVVGGIVIHVKNNTADTTDCFYDSEVIDKAFTLRPNANTDLVLVPAVPLFRTWPVTVTCQNGTKATADINF